MEDNRLNEQEWTTVIKPKNKLLSVDFKEIWRYRDLMLLFVKRNIITQYKQTILGPLWFLIQPMMTTIMYMVVFGGIAKISTDGLPQPLFYLALLAVVLGVMLFLAGFVCEMISRSSSDRNNYNISDTI